MLPVQKTLDIVIPVFNEEACLQPLMVRLLGMKTKIQNVTIRFIFVDDGSSDRSAQILGLFAEEYASVSVISLSRNFGHQMAITAGLDNATADHVVVIDADLQDPPELIEDLYAAAKVGFDIVYARRKTRKGETFFKLFTAKLFYWLISKMCDIIIPVDTADFRLMSQRVIRQLRSMRERHRFVRGLVPWIGFKSTSVYYSRDARFGGETKYPLRKMIAFSKDAIFSFSKTPLRITNFFGYVIVTLGIVGSVFMLYSKLMTNLVVPGITAIILTIIIMGGIQIIMLGIIGEYVGRIFEEAKNRPLYIVAATKNMQTPVGMSVKNVEDAQTLPTN